MKIQASGCYYHSGKLAVATCAKCGVGICRDCAVKIDQGTMLCYKCGNEQLKEEHKKYRKQLKINGGRFVKISEFVILTIIGVFLMVVAKLARDYGILSLTSNRDIIFYTYVTFSIPFGFVILKDLFAPKYDSIMNIMNKYAMISVTAWLIGWIVFPYALIKVIVYNIDKKK